MDYRKYIRAIFTFFKKPQSLLFFVVLFFSLATPGITHAVANIDVPIVIALLAFPILFEIGLKGIATLAGSLFNSILSKLVVNNTDFLITKNPVFLAAWNLVKNWANMLIVIALIGIAIATILRFKDYEAKKLLVPIIIVALLINFSVVLVGLIIDVSNFTMIAFLRGNNDQANEIIKKVNELEHENATKPIEAFIAGPSATTGTSNYGTLFSRTIAFVVIVMQFAVIYGVLALTFFFFLVLLIARQAVLAILFIFSPLAFVFKVFPLPDARKLWTSWWEHLIKWCFIGMGAAFSLWLAIQVLGNLTGSDLIETQIKLFIVIMILIIGLKTTLKSSAFGATAVLGLASSVVNRGKNFALGVAKGTAGAATGSAKWSAKWVADNTGVTRAKNAVQYGLTRAGETVGIFGRGTAAANWKAKEEAKLNDKDRQARTDALSNQELAGLVKSFNKYTPKTKAGREDRAAAFRAMQKRGILGMLDIKERKAAMDDMASRENSTKVYSMDADMVKFDLDGQREILYKKGLTLATANDDQKKDAIRQLRRKAYSTEKIENMENMSDKDVIEEAGENTSRGSHFLQEAIKRKIIHKVGENFKDRASMVQRSASYYGSSALKDAKKLDPRFEAYDQETTVKIEEELESKGLVKGSPEIKKAAQYEAVKRGMQKLGADKFADLDESAFDGELGQAVLDGTTKAHINRLMNRGPQVLMDKIVKKLEEEIARVNPKTGSDPDRRRFDNLRALKKEWKLGPKPKDNNDDDDTSPSGAKPKKPKGGGPFGGGYDIPTEALPKPTSDDQLQPIPLTEGNDGFNPPPPADGGSGGSPINRPKTNPPTSGPGAPSPGSAEAFDQLENFGPEETQPVGEVEPLAPLKPVGTVTPIEEAQPVGDFEPLTTVEPVGKVEPLTDAEKAALLRKAQKKFKQGDGSTRK